jgi:hypothetical protein
MLRRIALTLVPSVVVFTLAACLTSSVAPRAASKLVRTLTSTTVTVPHLAARSGYTVASS